MKTYIILSQEDVNNDTSGGIETMMNDLSDRGIKPELIVTDRDDEVLVMTKKGVSTVGVRLSMMFAGWSDFLKRRFFA